MLTRFASGNISGSPKVDRGPQQHASPRLAAEVEDVFSLSALAGAPAWAGNAAQCNAKKQVSCCKTMP